MQSTNRRLLLATFALLSLAFASIAANVSSAQEPPEDDLPVEDGETPAPVGLNPARALPGQEPGWWVKAEKPSLDVRETVLDNGMRVLTLKSGSLPVVATNLWYHVGAFHEPEGMTGVAHYLEHMMFKGGEKYAKGEIDDITTRHGGSNNASTSNDYTNYYFRVPASAWTTVLDIELDRMLHVELNQKEFDAEKLVVQEETNTAYDDPGQRIWQELMVAIYGADHPYAHPVLGFPRDVAGMTVEQMRGFHNDWYAPDNATLVVVGGIEHEEVITEVKKRFEELPKGRFSRVAPKVAQRPRARGQRRIHRVAEVDAASLMVAFPSDSVKSIRGPCRDVLANVLAGSETARLYKRLVLDEGLCTSVGAFEWNKKHGGLFVVSASMHPGASEETRKTVEATIREELERIATEPPSAEEVARAVKSHEVSTAFRRESADGLASDIGYAQVVAGDWRYLDNYSATLRAVQPDDVTQVAREWQWERDSVIAWLLPMERETGANPDPAAPPMPELEVTREVLPNGLTILMHQMPGGPEVFNLSIRHEAGARTEPAGQNGLAALFGAVIGTSTDELDRLGIAAIFDVNGGSFSAGAGGISARVLSKDWNDAVTVAADVLRNADFPEDQVEHERRQLLAAIAQLPESHSSLSSRAFSRALYGAEHPLGTPGAVSAESVAAITREQLLEHYRKHVAPNNTVVVVTGRFDAEAVKAKLTELLGDWQRVEGAGTRRSGNIPAGPRAGTQTFAHDGFSESNVNSSSANILIDHPEKSQCIVRVGRIGIPRDHPDYYACMVLDNILGTSAGFSDRLSKILRDEMGLAYSVSGNMTRSSSEDPGTFQAYIATRPEYVPVALEGMRKILRDIQSEQVSAEELERAKSSIVAGTLLGLEGSGDMAGLIHQIERYQLGMDVLKKMAEAVTAVTAEDVLRVAKNHLGPQGLLTVVAGPISRIPDAEAFFANWNMAAD